MRSPAPPWWWAGLTVRVRALGTVVPFKTVVMRSLVHNTGE
jgi:hypothetical protein